MVRVGKFPLAINTKADAYVVAGVAILVQTFFNLTDPPGPFDFTDLPEPPGPLGPNRRSTMFQPSEYYDWRPPFTNATRPAEFPDPNTPDNRAVKPFWTLSPAGAGPPSTGSQLTNSSPGQVIGTS